MTDLTDALIASAADLPRPAPSYRKAEAEGGCGVVGLAAGRRLPGRVLLQALGQMRNRGNGRGGGIAAAGLDPAFFDVRPEVLRADYLLAIAYLDPSARAEVEAGYVEPVFAVDHVTTLGTTGDPQRPAVWCYFARVRPDVRDEFSRRHRIPGAAAAEDEVVFQNSYRLNRTFYAATGEKRAFVLSHGQDLLVLKVVGYGDDVIRHYGIGDLAAHVWLGHHRYPTKGRVWHPGGAHPFVGMHEALVHNGDFANYAALCTYLRQRNRYPLFLTDTEVAALLFDLLHRVYGYPFEYVIEALAPTTDRDFALLPEERQRVYRMLQTVHMTGSPDGPWYFLLAQSARDAVRLVGVTDTSMLRPQVFALQQGEVGIGLAASEKQAIDAVLESLAREDPRFWRHADAYWHARGGSHTDGGAFVFTVAGDRLSCTDKFGRSVRGPASSRRSASSVSPSRAPVELTGHPPETVFAGVTARLPGWDEQQLRDFLDAVRQDAAGDEGRVRAFARLALLMDRRYPTGALGRSLVLSLLDECVESVVDDLQRATSGQHVYVGGGPPWPPVGAGAVAVLDARNFPSEGQHSLSRAIVELYRGGARRFLVVGVRGQRFIGCGLGPRSHGVRIDVFGSPGDYLGSGLDGADVVVHGSAQDQVGQILTDGRLVVHGDVGQAFLYAAKGGDVYVLGDTAGRTLINAVGRPRVVINGTCLDYLAESFMAGDPLAGGGFAVVNGITVDPDGRLSDRETPYSGGNLFSLAVAGALYIRDPQGMLTDDQLNGAEFTSLNPADWELIRPYLEENERLLGIPVDRLLTVDGTRRPPDRVYRKVRPVRHDALSPEEAWVRRKA